MNLHAVDEAPNYIEHHFPEVYQFQKCLGNQLLTILHDSVEPHDSGSVSDNINDFFALIRTVP